MEEWRTYKLSEICDLIAGFAFKSPDFGSWPAKVIKIGDIQPPYVSSDNMAGIDLSSYDIGKLTKYMVYYDDFVLAMTGATIGKIGRYIEKTPAYLNQRVLLFRPQDGVSKKFIYYSLLSKDFQGYVLNHIDSETAQPNISAKSIGQYEIRLPSISIQNKIAEVLIALDAKIELNRRINDNLEQQAQALYKSWFVDFEPFKGGKFVDSELGMIPEGWRVVSLGEITEECKEKVGNRIIKVLSPVTTGELVLSEEYFTKQVYSESIAKYIVVRPNAFAYNPARINIGSIGLNKFEYAGCVSPVYVVFKTQPQYEHFFDIYRTTSAFKEEVISRSMGGVRQTLGYKDFSLIQIVYPPVSVIESFNTVYNTIYAQTRQLLCEIEEIAKLRDTLLPKLISGELKPDQINL